MTAKIVLDTRYKRKDNEYPIVIRVRSGEQLRHVNSGYHIPKAAWKGNEVKGNYKDADIINAKVASLLAEVKSKLVKAKADNVDNLDIVLEGKPKKEEKQVLLFSDYIQERAKHFIAEKKIKHAKRILVYLYNLQECFNPDPLPNNITEGQQRGIISNVPISFALTTDDLRKFSAFLKNRNKVNTVAFKFSKLSQLFSNAIKEKKTHADNPFESFKIPMTKVHKAKLTEAEIAAIEKVSLPAGSLNDARNLFLFSYYCKGMRFEDCVRIKQKDIIEGRIVFKEIRKGKKTITVQLHPKLQALIKQYINNDTPYLLPFLKQELLIDKTGKLTEEAERERMSKVESQDSIVNRNLKVVAAAAGIDKVLTAHIARHSVAYNLKKKGVNVNVIKDILGHSSSEITERYLKELDDEIIDYEVNKLYE
jgi:integrase